MSGAGRDQKTGSPAEDERYAQQLADMQRLLRLPFLRGVLHEDVTFASGDTDFAHGLGRAPRGWMVMRAIGAAPAVHERAGSDARLLKLNVSVAATLTLWVW